MHKQNSWDYKIRRLVGKLFKLIVLLLAQLPQSGLFQVQRLIGQAMGKGWDSGIAHEIEIIAREIRKMNLGNTSAIDVGANVGLWSLAISEKFPKVAISSFEPSLATFKKLSRNVDKRENIQVYNFGLGEESVDRVLYSDEHLSGMASLTKRKLEYRGIDFENSEKVQIRTLDSWIQESGNKATILKIDVEGHELDVLKGAINSISQFKIIQFEFGGTDIDTRVFFRDFWDYFLSTNFSIFRLTPKGLVKVNEYSEHHEVFSFTTYFAIQSGE